MTTKTENEKIDKIAADLETARFEYENLTSMPLPDGLEARIKHRADTAKAQVDFTRAERVFYEIVNGLTAA